MRSGTRMSRYPHDAKVYVGDLGSNARKEDIEDSFSHYGPLRSVWVARNPPGFAFVEFEDARDAEDSVRGLDGRTICGRRVRVELSTGRGSRNKYSRRPQRTDERCYECGGRGHYARDCRHGGSGGGGGGGGSRRAAGRRRSRSRSYSRSRSRSRSREYRTRSRSYSRSKSRSHEEERKRSRSRSHRSEHNGHQDSRGESKTPRRTHSKSKSRSRGRESPAPRSRENGRDD